MHRARDSIALLLLLLGCSRRVPLKGRIGDLKAAQSTNSNVRNHDKQQECQEAHENTCQGVRVNKRGILMARGYEPGVKYWYSWNRDFDEELGLPAYECDE